MKKYLIKKQSLKTRETLSIFNIYHFPITSCEPISAAISLLSTHFQTLIPASSSIVAIEST
jgi:hypothetical protein